MERKYRLMCKSMGVWKVMCKSAEGVNVSGDE